MPKLRDLELDLDDLKTLSHGSNNLLILRLAQTLPLALKERWSTNKLAQEVECSHKAATRWLRAVTARAHRIILEQMTVDVRQAALTIATGLMRQQRRLDRLYARPDEEWSERDYAREEKSVSLLSQFLRLMDRSRVQRATTAPLPDPTSATGREIEVVPLGQDDDSQPAPSLAPVDAPSPDKPKEDVDTQGGS